MGWAYDGATKLVGMKDEIHDDEPELPRTLNMNYLASGVKTLVQQAGGVPEEGDESIVDLLGKAKDAAKAKAIVNANKEEKTFSSLCGFRSGQKEADLAGRDLWPGGARLLAWDLIDGNANDIAILNLSRNNLREGVKALAPAIKSSTSLASIDLSDNFLGKEGPGAVEAVAAALKDNSSLKSIDLSQVTAESSPEPREGSHTHFFSE